MLDSEMCKRLGITKRTFYPIARKYSVLAEIIDIFTQACKVCIYDEDVVESDLEHRFCPNKGTKSPTAFWERSVLSASQRI